MEDKRRFPRFDSTFEVEYYPQGNDAVSSYTVSKNVSRGGISFPALASFVKYGDILKLEIKIDDTSDSILASGRIRWIKQIKRPAILDREVGIEFTNIASDDLERLVS